MQEIWEDIPGYEGLYRASNYGQIKSLKYNKEKILKPATNKSNHLYVILSKNRLYKKYYVHRLVLESFIDLCPRGMECRHLDGNSQNNKLGNLKWGTHSENIQDSIKHGTFISNKQQGEKSHCAKLNNWKVRVIRRLLEDGYLTQKEIAKIFNISAATIYQIKNHQTWKCINE